MNWPMAIIETSKRRSLSGGHHRFSGRQEGKAEEDVWQEAENLSGEGAKLSVSLTGDGVACVDHLRGMLFMKVAI